MEIKLKVGDVVKMQTDYRGGLEPLNGEFGVKDRCIYEIEVKKVYTTRIVLEDSNASTEGAPNKNILN